MIMVKASVTMKSHESRAPMNADNEVCLANNS